MAAWPERALDDTEQCGVCQGDILIRAYDARRVKVHVQTEKLGPCHIECITKLVATGEAEVD